MTRLFDKSMSGSIAETGPVMEVLGQESRPIAKKQSNLVIIPWVLKKRRCNAGI